MNENKTGKNKIQITVSDEGQGESPQVLLKKLVQILRKTNGKLFGYCIN